MSTVGIGPIPGRHSKHLTELKDTSRHTGISHEPSVLKCILSLILDLSEIKILWQYTVWFTAEVYSFSA